MKHDEEKELKEMRKTTVTSGTMSNAPSFKLQVSQKKKPNRKDIR